MTHVSRFSLYRLVLWAVGRCRCSDGGHTSLDRASWMSAVSVSMSLPGLSITRPHVTHTARLFARPRPTPTECYPIGSRRLEVRKLPTTEAIVGSRCTNGVRMTSVLRRR